MDKRKAITAGVNDYLEMIEEERRQDQREAVTLCELFDSMYFDDLDDMFMMPPIEPEIAFEDDYDQFYDE